MIRKLDKLWFRVLGFIHCWTIRQAEAHCRREKLRRFRRLMVLAISQYWKNQVRAAPTNNGHRSTQFRP